MRNDTFISENLRMKIYWYKIIHFRKHFDISIKCWYKKIIWKINRHRWFNANAFTNFKPTASSDMMAFLKQSSWKLHFHSLIYPPKSKGVHSLILSFLTQTSLSNPSFSTVFQFKSFFIVVEQVNRRLHRFLIII